MKIKTLPINPHKADYIPFTGGLDITSPQIAIPTGYCRISQNFEEDILGGYQTVLGYERFNGQSPAPSEAVFYLLTYTGNSSLVPVGSTITGGLSGATAYVLAITSTQFVVTNLTGVFIAPYVAFDYLDPGYTYDTDTLVGTDIIITSVSSGAAFDDTTSYYQSLAADYYRSFIGKVGGVLCSGAVLGVWYYKGKVYAFRNLVAGGVGLFVSSSSGWLQVNLGYKVSYTVGTGTEPAVGTTIVKGGTSATLMAITVESGTFAAGTASGRLIFNTITGGPFTAGSFTSGISATCGLQSANSIPNQNGRYEFVTDSFTGLASSQKIYGVDGKNYGFEFDGTTYVTIVTGNVNDYPTHVTVHGGHLFYSFGGSVQFSAAGNPYNWQAISGAVEIGLSDDVTAFIRQPGNETSPALGIYCRNHIYSLYGNTPSTFQLVNYNDTAGAIPYSSQKINGQVYVYDDRGITNMQTTLNFGNFLEATISQRVKPLLSLKRSAFTDSHVVRDKQQYRLFFNDGSGIYITLSANINSFMPVQFPASDIVRCSTSQETYGGGQELIFVGMDTGYVMQMERGTSFDGQAISTQIELVFNNTKSYRLLKRYRRLSFEMIGNGYSEFNTSYDLNYASTDYAQAGNALDDVNMSAGFWDSGTIWDSNVTWDGQPLTNTSMAIDGDGMNIAVKIATASNYFYSVKFSGVLLEYSPSRMLR